MLSLLWFLSASALRSAKDFFTTRLSLKNQPRPGADRFFHRAFVVPFRDPCWWRYHFQIPDQHYPETHASIFGSGSDGVDTFERALAL